MLLGIWIAIHRLVYPDHLVKYVDNAYSILIILDITWVLARLSTALLQQYWGQRSDGHALKMMPVVRRTILVLIWIIGLVTALSNVGSTSMRCGARWASAVSPSPWRRRIP